MVPFFTLGIGRLLFTSFYNALSLSSALNLLLLSLLIQQIDENPLDGKVFDREALEELSKEGVTLVSLLYLLIIMMFLCGT